jgi:dihydroneopterin aldolase
MQSTIELTGLKLPVDLGTYGPGDIVPDAHWLDLTLIINPSRVLVDRDDMALVFDYDPLVREIDGLARDGHYQTQEWLMTRIVRACARYSQIEGVELMVYKSPVLAETGKLGVRLALDQQALDRLRKSLPTP